MAVSMRPTNYRGTPGWHIGGKDASGSHLSIFVRCRSTAVRIKRLVKTAPVRPTDAQWEARNKKMDMLIHADSRVKVCQR